MQRLFLNSLYGNLVPKRKLYCLTVDSGDSPFFFSMTLYARSPEQAKALFYRFIRKHVINFIGDCVVEVEEV